MKFLLPLLALSVACNGKDDDDSGRPVQDTEDTVEDTSPDVEPVWTEYRVETSSTLQGVYASGEGVYVVGTEGKAWVGGSSGSWTSMDPEVEENDLTDLWGQGAGASLTLVATAGGGYLATHAGGAWSTYDAGSMNHEGVSGSSPDKLFAVSWAGIQRFDGVAWTFEAAPGNERLNEVWASGDDAFAVGEEGAILRRDATTGAWTAMDAGVSANLNGVSGVSVNDVWAVGDEGTALHWDGAAWTAVDAGTTASLWAVFAPAATAVYVAGNNGTALRWTGSAFEELPTGVDNNLYALHGVSAANVWAVGNRGAALQFKAE